MGDTVNIQRMTVASEIVTPQTETKVLSPEAMDTVQTRLRGVHHLQRRAGMLSMEIARMEAEMKKLHEAIRNDDRELTELVKAEAAKFGIDTKDPQCPWSFNIDTGVFTKNTQE